MFNDDDDDREKDSDNEQGPRAIFTISGIPKNTDPVRLLRIIDDISESVYEKLDSLEIGMITNARDEKFDTSISPDDMKEIMQMSRYVVGGIPLHMKAQVAGGLIMESTFKLTEEAAELEQASKSDEEREAEAAQIRAQMEQYRREGIRDMKEQRTREIRQVFDIANAWAIEPGLTPMERCHGVAHDIYAIYGVDKRTTTFRGDPNYVHPDELEAYPINAGQAYAQHYDSQLSEQIKARSIKAAKDLFGGP